MLESEAVVDTSRANRYIAQLSTHLAHGPGGIRAHAHGDGQIVVDFGWGTCSMRAQPRGLLLRAAAPDTEKLGRVQRGVAARLQQIGRRDGLIVQWGSPAFTGPGITGQDDTPTPAHATPAAGPYDEHP